VQFVRERWNQLEAIIRDWAATLSGVRQATRQLPSDLKGPADAHTTLAA